MEKCAVASISFDVNAQLLSQGLLAYFNTSFQFIVWNLNSGEVVAKKQFSDFHHYAIFDNDVYISAYNKIIVFDTKKFTFIEIFQAEPTFQVWPISRNLVLLRDIDVKTWEVRSAKQWIDINFDR